jgi:hypothetical protein
VAKRNKPLGEAGLSCIAANSPQTYPQKMCTTEKSTDRLTSYGDFTEIGRAGWGKCQCNVKSEGIVILPANELVASFAGKHVLLLHGSTFTNCWQPVGLICADEIIEWIGSLRVSEHEYFSIDRPQDSVSFTAVAGRLSTGRSLGAVHGQIRSPCHALSRRVRESPAVTILTTMLREAHRVTKYSAASFVSRLAATRTSRSFSCRT